MTRAELAELLQKIHYEELEVRTAGQNEYCHDDSNCFANFEAAALELGGTREEDLMHLALKHWRGICAYVKGHTSQREDVRGRIKDLRMYLALLWGMIEENPKSTRCADCKTLIVRGLCPSCDNVEWIENTPIEVRCPGISTNNTSALTELTRQLEFQVSDCCGCSCLRCAQGHDTGPNCHTPDCEARFMDGIDKAAQDEESLIVCKNCEGPIEQDEYEHSGLCGVCEQTMNTDLDGMLEEVDTCK